MHKIFITLLKTIIYTSSEYAKCYLLSMFKKNHILNSTYVHKHKKCFVCTVYFDIEDDAVIILLRSSKLNILASAGVMTVKCLKHSMG